MTEETISIIITILNGAKWIGNCMESIIKQTAVKAQQPPPNSLMSYVTSSSSGYTGDIVHTNATTVSAAAITTADAAASTPPSTFHIEVCVFDDFSTDETVQLLKIWQRKFERQNICMHIIQNQSGKTKGVGHGRNMAIAAATGSYLCFQDIDDEMLPNRIYKQYTLAKRHQDAIIGSKFTRLPPNSTCRFSRWANELAPEKLTLQIYTANGPTIIMPTWLCHRSVFDKIPDGFCADGQGIPEDLIFFCKHLDRGGYVLRVDECLLKYRYHPEATTFSIAAKTIWRIRMQHLILNVLTLPPWCTGFTIWNAGKQGRKFFRDLPLLEKNKVVGFCDVDKNKIRTFYRYYDESKRRITHSIPIVHFTEAKPPLLICMKLDLTEGAFEANLKSLNLTEGKDYILFT